MPAPPFLPSSAASRSEIPSRPRGCPARSALLPSRWELFPGPGLGGICLSPSLSCSPARSLSKKFQSWSHPLIVIPSSSPSLSLSPPATPPRSSAWPLLSSASVAPLKASASQPSPLQSTSRVLNGIEFWPGPSGQPFRSWRRAPGDSVLQSFRRLGGVRAFRRC